MTEPEVGARIGAYEIRRLLGEGGMGAVYLAEDHSLGRRVAVKMLPPHLAAEPEIVERFQREARALAKLRHPNLMHIYTVGEHAGRPYFAMEYIEGSTLSAIIAQTGPLPPAQAAHITGEVLSALDKVHGVGMIHRDIKPGNIIIDEDGRAVLMDFGLARQEQEAPLTADYTVLGTPKYMSPEQAKGARADARTDIYSLGVVLYEMLTGQPPFDGKTSFEILRKHIESSVPAPSELRPGIPPEFDVVVAKAVAKSPEDRYSNVAEMAAALSAVYPNATLLRLVRGSEIATQPTVVLSQSRGEFASTVRLTKTARPAAATTRMKRRLKVALAAAAAVVVALLALLVFQRQPEPTSTPAPAAGQLVEIRRRDADTVRGRLIAIEVLDDGTTTAKIEAEGSERTHTISIQEGDELHVVHER